MNRDLPPWNPGMFVPPEPLYGLNWSFNQINCNMQESAQYASQLRDPETMLAMGQSNARCPSCTKFIGDWEHDPDCAWRAEQARLCANDNKAMTRNAHLLQNQRQPIYIHIDPEEWVGAA